jgi:chitinase
MIKKALKNSLILLLGLVISTPVFGQLPNPAIVGYLDCGQSLKLRNIDPRYNVVQISFAKGQSGTDYNLAFSPVYDEDEFKSDVEALQAEGKKVLISIGGQYDPVMLDSLEERDIFVSSVNAMIDKWGFDGFDIDLEGQSLGFSDIHVQNPGDIRHQYLIQAIDLIMKNHLEKHGVKLLLTMAPETLYVQGGLSTSSFKRGAYLPIIEAFKESIDMLNVQLYNSGSQFGLDGKIYNEGNADWILAMTEAVIQGFECKDSLGTFSGLPAHKVGVGLPACHSSDAVPHKEIEAALLYLIGEGPQPGSYKLIQEGGYPDLRGMMTWSINSDRTCYPSYGFVDTYSKIFTSNPYIEIKNSNEIYEGIEAGGKIEVELFKDVYSDSLNSSGWDISNLPEGVELDSVVRINDTLAQLLLKGNSYIPYSKTILNTTVELDSSELKNSIKKLSRSSGVILKPSISEIPGYVEIEKYIDFKGCGVGNISEDDGGGKFGWIWKGHWAEIEVNIAESGDYVADFRYRTSPGTHKCILKVDGAINSINKINRSAVFKVWENKEFNVKLTEGFHKLRFHMAQGWVHLDRVDFRSTLSNNSFSVFNKTFFYPNPSSQTIYFDNELKGTVKIFGMRGELVKHVSLNRGNPIEIRDLKAGIYTVQLIDLEGGIHHDKLVKK